MFEQCDTETPNVINSAYLQFEQNFLISSLKYGLQNLYGCPRNQDFIHKLTWEGVRHREGDEASARREPPPHQLGVWGAL